MSPVTSLRCPHCGYSAQSAKPISLGAAVRCTRCKSVFRVAPSHSGSAQSPRTVEAERLQELFAADNNLRPRPRAGKLKSASSAIRTTDPRPVQQHPYQWR